MGKQFRIKVGACWLLLGLLFASIHLSQGVSLSRRLAQAATEEDNLICQVHINAILPPSGNISVDDEKNGQFTTCSLWVTGETTQGAYLVDTPGWILDYYQTPLRQGSPVFLIIPDGSVSQDRIIIPQPDTVSVLAEDHHERRRRRRRNLQQPTGKRTVMLRIRGLDAEPDFSIQELTSYLITHPLSARRQLERCSQNLLTLDASRYGVLDVPLNVEIQGLTNLQVMNLAETYVNEVILKSDSQVSNIRAWVDFLLFVIPPGTGGWAAFATVSGKQSVYNNRWGGYLGGLLHEIGHNLGLDHAFEDGNEYDGTTGYMGDVPPQVLAPLRCYNAHNHYLLSWYPDRTLEVDPNSPQLVTLAPFVQYDDSAPDEHIIVHMGDLYMQYNRAIEYNAESGEKRDKLVIVRDKGNAKGTELLVGLDVGEDYHYDDGKEEITVHVCSRIDQGGAYGTDILLVSVGYGVSLCNYNGNPAPAPRPSPNSPSSPGPPTAWTPTFPSNNIPSDGNVDVTAAPTLIVGDTGDPNAFNREPLSNDSGKSGLGGIMGAVLGMVAALALLLFVYCRRYRKTDTTKPKKTFDKPPKVPVETDDKASVHSSDTKSSSEESFANEFPLSPLQSGPPQCHELPICGDPRSADISLETPACPLANSVYEEDVEQGLTGLKARMRESLRRSTRHISTPLAEATTRNRNDPERTNSAAAEEVETKTWSACWTEWFDFSKLSTSTQSSSTVSQPQSSSYADFFSIVCGFGTSSLN